jgi:hypothetical protein
MHVMASNFEAQFITSRQDRISGRQPGCEGGRAPTARNVMTGINFAMIVYFSRFQLSMIWVSYLRRLALDNFCVSPDGPSAIGTNHFTSAHALPSL